MNPVARCHPLFARLAAAAALTARRDRRRRRRPSGTCPPPIRRPTSTPRTCSSSPTTSTRRAAASSRSPSTPTPRCSRRNEIKRAVQGGQAPIGEVLLVNFENENPLYGADGIPVPRRQLRRVEEARHGAEAGPRQAARRAGNDAALHRAVAAAGHLRQEGNRLGRRHARPEVARLQPGHGQDRRADRRAAGHRAGRRAVAGARHRRRRELHVVGLDRLRLARPTSTIKYWYDTQAWLPKNAVLVNKKSFDALDKATQDAVLKAAADAEVRGAKVSEEKNDWYKKALAEKGMKIMKPPAEADDRHAPGRHDHARRLGEEGRGRRPGPRRRVPQVDQRRRS